MISLLLVNYRASALAGRAIETARAASSSPLQVVAVDNSCDSGEAGALRSLADRLIVSPTNRGYAGGINAGRAACDGDVIVISNPDVDYGTCAIDYLVAALDGAAVAGPALFWDDDYEWMLPPGDLLTAVQKVDEVLASRSRSWSEQRDRRRIRKRVRFWSIEQQTRVGMLSGAVMAVRARDFDDVGGFDERFELYFEETDFLRRISARRKRIVFEPRARCRHIYNQSAGQHPDVAADRYATSEVRYLEKWNGPFAARALKRLGRPLPAHEAEPMEGPIVIDRDDLVVEASPLATFSTAAGHFPRSRSVDLPAEVLSSAASPVVYMRTIVRRTGEVLATYARRTR